MATAKISAGICKTLLKNSLVKRKIAIAVSKYIDDVGVVTGTEISDALIVLFNVKKYNGIPPFSETQKWEILAITEKKVLKFTA